MKSLAYADIRKELTAFLKSSPQFKDYNFDAAGMSALVNILAYNDHRFGYFAKMMLDESFVDSAHTIPALLSHAKRLGYMARGKKAAVISPVVTAAMPLVGAPSSVIIEVPRGTKFKAANSDKDTRVFTSLVNQTLNEIVTTIPGQKQFRGTLQLHEGTIKTRVFATNGSVVNPLYEIKDSGLDITTLAVFVKEQGAQSEQRVKMAAGPEDVNPAETVFYAVYDRTGVYKLFFSAQMTGGSQIRVEYLSCTGSQGNGADEMTFARGTAVSAIDINGVPTVTAVVAEKSQGGADEQSIEELRLAIPASFRRQYRAVTTEDIATIVRDSYGDVSSVNVWGGEDETPRRYGKKFICLTPRSSRILSIAGRQEVKDILEKYRIPGDDIVFVDAVEQLISVVVSTRKRATSAATDGEVRAATLAVVDDYLGLSRNASILDFSSSGLVARVQREVEAVEYAYPATFFVNAVVIPAALSSLKLEFGNEIHGQPLVQNEKGQQVVITKPTPSSLLIEKKGVGDYSAVFTTTPVVPELRAARNTYFEVVSRDVKVVR